MVRCVQESSGNETVSSKRLSSVRTLRASRAFNVERGKRSSGATIFVYSRGTVETTSVISTKIYRHENAYGEDRVGFTGH